MIYSYTTESEAYDFPIVPANFQTRTFRRSGPNECNCVETPSGDLQTSIPSETRINNRKYLSTIEHFLGMTLTQKVLFEISDNPCSTESTNKKLDRIRIFKGNNASIGVLDYNFTYDCSTNRLTLLECGERPLGATDFAAKPPYSFEYDNTTLPSVTSLAQDHYGYFNGATGNTGLIPSVDVITTWIGANRDVDETKAKAGSLNKIIYPTGGYKSISYESNSQSKSTTTESYACDTPCREFRTCTAGLGDCCVTIDGIPNVSEYNSLVSFRNDEIQDGSFYVRSDSICGNNQAPFTENGKEKEDTTNANRISWSGIVEIEFRLNANDSLIHYHRIEHYNTLHLEYLDFSSIFPNLQSFTLYKLKILAHQTEVNIELHLKTQTVTIQNEPVGGLRIKEISHFERDNTLLTKREYTYTIHQRKQYGK